MNGQRQHEWEEEPRDETTAAIYGYSHPAWALIGRCCYCGGAVWPIEDTYWDGAENHYFTFAYQCYGCGHMDVSPCFVSADPAPSARAE